MSHDQHSANAEDELMAQLGELPARDIDQRRAARLADVARATFVRSHRRAQPRRTGALRLYTALEPALVAVLCALYLGWALQQVIALHQ